MPSLFAINTLSAAHTGWPAQSGLPAHGLLPLQGLPVRLARSAAKTTPSAANDRGVVHQLLVDVGVSSNTAHTIQVWTIGPLRIVVILLIAWILTRLERRYALRLVHSLRLISPILKPTERSASRAQTLAGVLSAVVRVVIWVIAGLTVLDQLGIKLGAFVAGATIIGAALGFGAQTLVKDFLSGMLILAEDQYGVGDDIVVNNTTGTVEGMTLRVTRVRSVDGVIWYVPNGDIRTVGNNSEGDSVALVEVVVPLGTDLVAAGQAAEQEARTMAAERAWSGVIVGEPTFAGIPTVAADGATLRVMARTVPGQHIRAGRELRLRLLERLRREGLAWAPAPPAELVEPAGPGEAGATGPGPAPEPEPPAPQPPTPRSRTPRRPRRPARDPGPPPGSGPDAEADPDGDQNPM